MKKEIVETNQERQRNRDKKQRKQTEHKGRNDEINGKGA